jgi:UDP-glucose 4-epimerase
MSRGISPIIYGDGTQTRDFTFVGDVVEANILAMKSEKDFAIYNVGTGTKTSFNEIIGLLNTALGTDITPTYVNNPIKNYVQETMADISLARSEIGFRPEHRLEASIKELAKQLPGEGLKTLSQTLTR